MGCLSPVYAWSPEYESAMNRSIIGIYYERPVYISPRLHRADGTIGARLAFRDEIDCSLLFGRAAEDSGIPGMVYRPTASLMYKGQGGWKSRVVKLEDSRPGDLIFQHIPESKGGLKKPKTAADPYGVNHVLGIVEHDGVQKVIHASSSAQTVKLIPLQGWVTRWMVSDGFRRPTKGEVVNEDERERR